mmetsp:Transcript_3255/g.4700  ORF Transcript_3255/g.4700 Transcript_3255/m.4700 type:complete len:105 (-) Transcript_3255:253-567(-)
MLIALYSARNGKYLAHEMIMSDSLTTSARLVTPHIPLTCTSSPFNLHAVTLFQLKIRQDILDHNVSTRHDASLIPFTLDIDLCSLCFHPLHKFFLFLLFNLGLP